MGIAHSTVFNWTTSVSEPSPVLLREVSRICGVSADWILTGEAPRPDGGRDYPSREKFLSSHHGLDESERVFLASIDLGPEDPGAEIWPMLLNVRRQMQKQRAAAAAKERARHA